MKRNPAYQRLRDALDAQAMTANDVAALTDAHVEALAFDGPRPKEDRTRADAMRRCYVGELRERAHEARIARVRSALEAIGEEAGRVRIHGDRIIIDRLSLAEQEAAVEAAMIESEARHGN